MEMGETVAQAAALQAEGKCVICSSKTCEKPKKEDVQKTAGKSGWDRDESMAGVFETGDTARCSVYPGASFPPPYPTEGHHCLVFTSFVKDGEDRCVRLNHFLYKVGFGPNQPRNIIQLPGRRGAAAPAPGKTWPPGAHESYKNYWISIDLGKPLQLHAGRHAESYFGLSHALARKLSTMSSNPETCKQKSQKEIEDRLKELAEVSVNYAFIQVAEGVWPCHPERLMEATALYSKPSSSKVGQAGGYGGAGNPPPPWTSVDLDTGPF